MPVRQSLCCAAGVGLLAIRLARRVVLALTDAGVARLTESAGPSARSLGTVRRATRRPRRARGLREDHAGGERPARRDAFVVCSTDRVAAPFNRLRWRA